MRRMPSLLHQAAYVITQSLLMELLHSRLTSGIPSAPLWKTHKA